MQPRRKDAVSSPRMAALDPSDLMGQLDSLANATPISEEDDLILRMQAVSKVRHSSGSSSQRGEKKGAKSKAAGKPANPISKKKSRPAKSRGDGMQVEGSSAAAASTVAAAKAAVREHLVQGPTVRLRTRSNSV